jgi:hypothetical protein
VSSYRKTFGQVNKCWNIHSKVNYNCLFCNLDIIEMICQQMCQHLFGKKYTTHSIRRSAAQWAARCGADDSTINESRLNSNQ